MHRQIKINEQILDTFVELIENHEAHVLYDYKGKENQILLQAALVTRITTFLDKNLTTSKYPLKDLIKAYIRAAFELHDNAVVINRNSNIFIKIIDESVQKKVDEKDKNTVKNRYNGVNEEELKSFYEEFFAQDENKNFF